MQIIEVPNLVYILVPALLVVLIQWRWALSPGTSLYAIARMVLQLVLIGYVLTTIFASDRASLVLMVLTIMLIAASWIALRPVPEHRNQLFLRALTATFLVNAAILALITELVLQSEPWYSPRIVIPLAGMVFAAGMNAISLFAERYFAELSKGGDEILSRNTAYQATLIPTVNSLFAVGLVSLPGMMTGQILSGVSPLIAVRYQIVIMLMIFASSGLTAALFYKLLPRKMHRSGRPD
ncbi:MAG: ABC transporter permease [Pseudomonadota bacterium]